MKKVFYITIVFMGGIFFSCGPSLYIPTSIDPVQQEKLLQGRKLYVSICSSCHNLYLPKNFTTTEWQKNLDKMQERAKITNEQKQLIYEYLNSQPGM